MNFRSLFAGQRNLALFIPISILLVLWLSSSFWVQAYFEREDAKKIQRFNVHENHLFDLSTHLSEQRSLIHRLLNGDAGSVVSVAAYNDTLNTTDSKIQNINSSFLKNSKSNSETIKLAARAGTSEHRLKRIDDHQKALRKLAVQLEQQMKLPKDQRDTSFKMTLFRTYTDFIEAVGDIRQSVHFVPRFTNQEVLYYSELLNAAWFLNESTSQIDSLLEGIGLNGLDMTPATTAYHATMINESIVQSDMAVKSLLRQRQKINLDSSLEVRIDDVVELYNQRYKALSQNNQMSLLINSAQISSLDTWKNETVQLNKQAEIIGSQAKSRLIENVINVEETATRNIIIDTFLVLLCLAMGTASLLYFKKIHRQAHHDELTGLPNRRMFLMTLNQMMECACIESNSVWLLTIDLDRFKEINDSMGHAIGDLLLKQVAERLQHAAGDAHVARMGGDEFMVLVAMSKSDSAHTLADEIHQCLCEPFLIDGGILHIGGSVGVCGYPNDVDTPEELLKASDLAMYRAKNLGRNLVVHFERAMATDYEQRLNTERELQFAVAGNQFELHFQPKFNRSLGRVDSVEALIRWNHPERGQVAPNHFIPIAEECGMLPHIGNWVLDEACRNAAKWVHDNGVSLRVAVNVSTEQFLENDFVEKVFKLLDKHQLAPKHLELEVTESVVMADVDKVVAALTQLRNSGIKIALDDFGTGYSSLSYLQKLPLDTLKIDKSFVQKLEVGSVEIEAITQAIAQLANTLSLETVAEGVETEDQLSHISNLGIDVIQGFLYSKPVPALDVIRVVEQINDNDGDSADAA